MFWGLFSLPWWGYVLVTLALTHVTIVTVTVFLHRYQAHKGLDMHPALSHFFRFWLWLTTGMVTKAWVAVHRKHHAKVETEQDPHSPQVLSLSEVLWTGAELYRKEAACKQTLRDYGQGTPDDWLERNLYTPREGLGIRLMLLIDVLLFGVPGVAVWAIQMLWIPIWAAGVINGLAHWFGYRNFETPDASTNLVPWGLFIGGEELHNNHHAFANSAKFSSRWWEFDIGWFYLRLFQALGLVQIRKVAPELIADQNKKVLDLDALAAIVQNHVHVLARYRREVVSRVHREEMRKVDAPARRALLRRAGRLICRHKSRLDQYSQKRLQNLLKRNNILQAVYLHRERLQETLQQVRRISDEQRLEQLREWCRQAEATGIAALSDFAQRLHYYTLRNVPA